MKASEEYNRKTITPDLIAVASSCLTETIGDDMAGYNRKI